MVKVQRQKKIVLPSTIGRPTLWNILANMGYTYLAYVVGLMLLFNFLLQGGY